MCHGFEQVRQRHREPPAATLEAYEAPAWAKEVAQAFPSPGQLQHRLVAIVQDLTPYHRYNPTLHPRATHTSTHSLTPRSVPLQHLFALPRALASLPAAHRPRSSPDTGEGVELGDTAATARGCDDPLPPKGRPLCAPATRKHASVCVYAVCAWCLTHAYCVAIHSCLAAPTTHWAVCN